MNESNEGDLTKVCGQGVFTKLRLLPRGGTKEDNVSPTYKNRRTRFSKRKNKQLHSGSPFDLTPIDLRTPHQTFMTEDSSICHSFQARSIQSDGEPIAQFEVLHTIDDVSNGFISLSSMGDSSRDRRDPTPRATNSKQPNDKAKKSQHLKPQDHLINSQSLIVSAFDEAPTGDHQSFQSTISSKESGDAIDDIAAKDKEKQEQMVTAMKNMIIKQQHNLSTLAEKNQVYRNRLVASHDRVIDLRKEHLEQKDAISKLQFERESFEAEAIWLREELLSMKDQIQSLANNSTESQPNLESMTPNSQHRPDRATRDRASSETRWSRPQGFILDRNKDCPFVEDEVALTSPRADILAPTTIRPNLRVITDAEPSSPISHSPDNNVALRPAVTQLTPNNNESRFAKAPTKISSPTSEASPSPSLIPRQLSLSSPRQTASITESDADLQWARDQMKTLALIKKDIKSRDSVAAEKFQNGPTGNKEMSPRAFIVTSSPKSILQSRVMKLRATLEKMQINKKDNKIKMVENRDESNSLRTEVGLTGQEGNGNKREILDVGVYQRADVVKRSELRVHYQLKGRVRMSHDGIDSI